ncbi:MAG: alpha/beta hydrolase [Thermoanaerobaculia bacterium]
MKRGAKAGLAAIAGSALSLVGGSWLAARSLSRRLVSAQGLKPASARREDLFSALARAAPIAEDFRHAGSPRHPVLLAAIFASPGEPAGRPTLLFTHGKGGNAAEWQADALRALDAGYNVLLPELRGHAPSGGGFVTYGLLEKEDLGEAVAWVRDRFGIDPERIGIHSCSAGSAIALEFAAHTRGVRALWLESPFAEPAAMARHYLSRATGLPGPLLHLTSRWAVRRALERIRKDLGPSEGRLELLDPVRTLSRLSARVLLVYGEKDELVPPRFVRRLVAALPPGGEVWRTPAGHCHHDDQTANVLPAEYDRRWRDFFGRQLPVGPEGSKQ